MALIVDDILLAQCKLVYWVGKKLYELAEQVVTDESVIRQELLELQMRFELDEISEQEYRDREDALMRRMEQIREYKEKRGLD